MNLHEYQGKEILNSFGVRIQRGIVANTAEEAVEAAKKLTEETGTGWHVVKAQVHAGGRGKGGGVKLAKNLQEVENIANEIIGMQLVTPQTSAEGKKVNQVLITEDVYYPGDSEPEEYYMSVLLNRATGKNMIMYSTEGGMDIETVAEETPHLIFTEEIDPGTGILPYIESVRQLKWELGENNALVIHLTLVPYLSAAKELKTKPTQHSVKTLMESGISADILVCRTEHELSQDLREKLALFCNVKKEAVIQSIDASTIYDVPNYMLKEGLDTITLEKLALPDEDKPDLTQWNAFLERHKNPKAEVTIGLVGKYVELQDSYKSILESFIHAGAENEVKVNIRSIHSEFINAKNADPKIEDLDGILVAPGFGERGIKGKIAAVNYARENNLPFFGICLGMQMAVIEYARNVLNIEDANSTEMDDGTANPVIDIMESQKNITQMGGTMRLGAWDCDLKEGSLIHKVYGKTTISERHRHRYEYNSKYQEQLEKAGMMSSGINPQTGLVEAVEIPDHPWFVGVQYHPEYKSTVATPHPLFIGFVKAAKEFSKKRAKK